MKVDKWGVWARNERADSLMRIAKEIEWEYPGEAEALRNLADELRP